jgi:hypothetical protein
MTHLIHLIHQNKMKVIAKTNELSRNEWLELRRKGIGGSDAGVSAGRTVYSPGSTQAVAAGTSASGGDAGVRAGYTV